MEELGAPAQVAQAAGQSSFKFLSASGATMMEVESVGRAGDKLVMKGKMMGEFPQEVFLPIEQFVTMAKMGLTLGTLQFIAMAPFLGLARIAKENAATGRKSGSAIFMLSFLAALLVVSPLLLPVLLLALIVAIPVLLIVGCYTALNKLKPSPKEEAAG